MASSHGCAADAGRPWRQSLNSALPDLAAPGAIGGAWGPQVQLTRGLVRTKEQPTSPATAAALCHKFHPRRVEASVANSHESAPAPGSTPRIPDQEAWDFWAA